MAKYDAAKARAKVLDNDAMNEIKEWCALSSKSLNGAREDQTAFNKLAMAIHDIQAIAER